MMQALVKRHPIKGLQLECLPKPSLGAREILIRVLKTSLCGTDLNLYHWTPRLEPALSLPVIIGHEFVGEIAAIGEDVSGFSVGQIASGETATSCGHCRDCLHASPERCLNLLYTGITRPGACAEYM